MAETNAAPSPNPFDQIDPAENEINYKPAAKPTNPFDDGIPELQSQSSTVGAFTRGAIRNVLPGIGSLPAIGAGAEAGAWAGAPFGPWGSLAGGLAGGVYAGYKASQGIATAQNYAVKKLPDSVREKIGLDERQEELDQGEHPTASFLGGLAPFAVTMHPLGAASKALPENATTLERIMAHPATSRVFSGAVMGGMELGNQAAQGQSPDWTHAAIATGFGIVFNRPTKIGERLIEAGGTPTRRLLGVPEPSFEAAPPASEPPAAPEDAAAFHVKHEPTLAEASDLKVIGPGVTEEVFQGAHRQNEEARTAAEDLARTEQTVLGEPSAPDLHAVARRMHPDLFERYDALAEQRDEFNRWISAHPEYEYDASRHLASANEAIADLLPEIRAAYRRAAEATGAPTIGPEAPASKTVAPPGTQSEQVSGAGLSPGVPPRTIQEQKAFIRDDVARQMIAAGRPEQEARDAGALAAVRYEARAGWFRGALGTAEELYRSEGAEILGPGARTRQAAERVKEYSQFAGPRAATAVLADLDRAKDMIAAGSNEDAIWKETGWYRGTDDKWRFEIDDSKAKLTGVRLPPPDTGILGVLRGRTPALPLRAVLDHPQLYEAYPDAARIYVVNDARLPKENASMFLPSDQSRRAILRVNFRGEATLSNMLHEIQHWIQEREGFTEGNSGAEHAGDNERYLTGYILNPGEVEARNTAKHRLSMSVAERRANPPNGTSDEEHWRHLLEVVREHKRLTQEATEYDQLRLARQPNEVRNEDVHYHDITDEHGHAVGEIKINAADPVNIDVRWIGRTGELGEPFSKSEEGHEQGDEYAGANTLGPKETRSLIPQLQAEYPYLETINGERVSGARFRRDLLEDIVPKVMEDHPRAAPELQALIDRKASTQEIAAHPLVREEIEEHPPSFEQVTLRLKPRGYAEGELRRMLEQGAPAAEIAAHPQIKAALRRDARETPTSKLPGYGTQAFKLRRVFDFDGEPVKGYHNAIDRLTQQARDYADGPVAHERKALVIIGLPGSGKSTLATAMAKVRKAAIPDPDDARHVIPEYANAQGSQAVKAEAHDLVYGSGGVGEKLIAQGSNIVIPTSGRDYNSLRGFVSALREAGYEVDLAHVDIDKDEAFRRSVSRFLGRPGERPRGLVPQQFIEDAALNAPENYHKLQAEGLIHEAIQLDGRAPRGDIRILDGEGTQLARDIEPAGRLLRGSVVGGAEAVRANDQGAGEEQGRSYLQGRALDQAPTFFSSVSRAVDQSKQDKASPEQWLGMIKNTSGVRPEEMEWLGLADWLKEQKGSVTKQALQDYIRANAIEVREVERRPPDPKLDHELAEARDAFDTYAAALNAKYTEGLTANATKEELDQHDRLHEALDQARGRAREGVGVKFGPNSHPGLSLPGGENYRELLLTLPTADGKVSQEGARWRVDYANGEHSYYLTRAEAQQGATSHQPSNAVFRTSHWNEPNVLAHIRFNDRTIDGKKTLFLEEIQSDWHQKGKREGYQKQLTPERRADLERQMNELQDQEIAHAREFDRISREGGGSDSAEWQAALQRRDELRGRRNEIGAEIHPRYVPDAPFKTTWPELTLKRMIRYAAEHGYDKLAWTPGEVQADRYDLSKQISRLDVTKTHDGTYSLSGHRIGTRSIHDTAIHDFGTGIAEDKLPDHVGKEISEKIAERNLRPGESAIFQGLDLKVGGEGMLGFYDDILPAVANKLVKKFGSKVKREGVPVHDPLENYSIAPVGGFLNRRYEVRDAGGYSLGIYPSRQAAETAAQRVSKVPSHVLDITPELREAAVEKGFPLFQTGARGRIRFIDDQRPVLRLFRDANASTIIHEMVGHEWLEQLARDAEHPQAPDQLRTDAATTAQWLGLGSLGDLQSAPKMQATRAHEKFARAAEQYLRLGIAPTQELAGVFARFKQWLMNIYETIKGLGHPINEDIRQVFDRMLATEPHRTVVAPERAKTPTLADIHEGDLAEIAPREADPVLARVDQERLRAYTEDEEHAREIEETLAKFYAEHEPVNTPEEGKTLPAEAGGSSEPGQPGAAAAFSGGEADEGAAGPRQVHPGGEPAGTLGGSRSTGAPAGEVSGGRGEARTDRNRGTAGERTGGTGEEPGALPLAARPAADLTHAGERFNLGKDGNIRTENLTSVRQFVEAIEESKERIGGSGPMTQGQFVDLADSMGMDPKEIDQARLAQIFGGIQDLGPKIRAFRIAVEKQSETVAALMQKVRDTDSDEAVADFAKEVARFDMMTSVLSSVTTEWGRAGMGFRNLENWPKSQDLNTLLKENTGRTLYQLKQIAKLGAQLDTPGKVAKFLRDAQKRSFGGMLLEYWINGLISGPATHATYMIGNAILSIQKALPETLIAAAIGEARSAMGREGPTVRAGEAAIGLKTMVQGLPTAVQAAMEAIHTGQATLLPGQQGRPLTPFQGDALLTVAKSLTNDPVTWREVGSQAFGLFRSSLDGIKSGAALLAAGGEAGAPLIGLHYSPLGQIPDVAVRGVRVLPVGTALRLPGRAVAAIHSFFAASNYLREVATEAYRTAANEGLVGTDFAARIADIRQNPSQEVMERAIKGAYAATLMSEGGAFVKALSALTNAKANLPLIGEIRPLKFVDPFVHIGANVINQAVIQRTPIGILSSEIRADLAGTNGTVAQDMAMARMLAGTALSIGFGALAMGGYATGSGPNDRHKAAMWRLAGYQPHSVRVGDIWYQMNRLGPMGMLVSIAADMYDVAHEASNGELLTAGAHLQHAITQNILDESFMRGPADLIKAIEDPGRYGEAYIRQFASSFLPYSVGMAQIARAADPYSRIARTVMDQIKAKIPGVSETLMPRRDIWGEEIHSSEVLGLRGLTAIYETQLSTDPVNIAMLQLGISPAQVERKIRNVELTAQQFDDFARIAGRMTKMRLDLIVRSPDWQTWPNHIKHDVIAEVLKQSREAARGVIMGRYPEIVQQATAAKLKRLQD